MIPIYEADRLEDLPLFDRPPQAEEDVDAAVAAILADVRTRGDEALREYTRRFDGADLERFAGDGGGAARRLGPCGREFPGDAAAGGGQYPALP